MRYKFYTYPILLMVLICVPLAQQKGQAQVLSEGLRWDAIGAQIVKQMDLQANEQVLLVGNPGRFDPLVSILTGLIEKKSAIYLGTLSVTDVQPEEWTTNFTRRVLGQDAKALEEYFKSVDLGVMLPGTTPADLPYHVLQEKLNKGKGRTIHFHWMGSYDLNGNMLEMDDAMDMFYQKVLLETNYAALAKKQQEIESALRGQTISVTTPAGTDISFRIADRPVNRQDGDASASRMKFAKTLIDREIELPPGAMRMAPIESSVNGVIAFPDSKWSDSHVEGLMMTFEAGKVVDYQAVTGREAVTAELDAGGSAAHSFREFALGVNPLMTVQNGKQPWIPSFGYGAGVVRLSLGNNLELGGIVDGDYVRWNFFTDTTVKIGNDVWVKDGKLIR